MLLSRQEIDNADEHAIDFNDRMNKVNKAFTKGMGGEGPDLAALMNLRTASENPDIKIPADAYVDFVANYRIDWDGAKKNYLTGKVAEAILTINERPEIQAEYKRQGIAPIEGAHSYAHLDKKYPIK